jgi:hypothetical protein
MERHHVNATILGVVLCFLLASVFLSAVSPADLSRRMAAQIGAVGISLGISPNPENSAAAELAQKEAMLAAKERALASKEEYLAAQSAKHTANALEYSFLGGALLIALILLNIYFDYVALKSREANPSLG